MKRITIATALLALAMIASTGYANEHGMDEMHPAVTKAIAVLYPTSGNLVSGVVTFTKVDGGIHVVAEVSGLKAGTHHGFHIHQYGDCSASDGTSAGGHFNPQMKEHGSPSGEMRHVGDMGNLTVDANGVGHVDYVDPMMTFEGPNSIIGRGVVVHAGEDDLTSQPTGAAGARVACGVIGIANPGN